MRRRTLFVLLLLAACSGGNKGVPPPSSEDGGTSDSQPPEEPKGVSAVASFDRTDGSGVAPDTEGFDGSASSSKDQRATLSCAWTFGDGASATGCQVTHTFADAGDFTVTLTVTDTDGSQDTATLAVQVTASEEPPPGGVVAVANFEGTQGSGTAPDTEKFDGTASYSQDPAATLTTCAWTFGDGDRATGCKVSHTFSRAGSFTVVLTVTDSDGSEDQSTLAVKVSAPEEPPPHGVVAVARLDGTDGSGIAPDTEKFDGTASYSQDPEANLTACAWTFGDGASATGCKVSHVFAHAGAFTVTLTVSDSDGSEDTGTLVVTVSEPPPGVVAVARFDGTRGAGTVPDTEKFDGTASYSQNPQATVSACEWTFGDGAAASGCKVGHTFTRAGAFTVTLTVHASDGTHATDTVAVQVEAPPDHVLRWARSGLGGGVGTDFSSVIAEAGGNRLQRIDPSDGQPLWQRSFGDPINGQPYTFFGPVFVAPDAPDLFVGASQGYPPYHSDTACSHSTFDGVQWGCFAGQSLETGGLASLSMGGGGEVAVSDFATYQSSVVVRRTDSTTWAVLMDQSQPSEPARFAVDRVSTEPGGDALVDGRTLQPFSFGGQTFSASQHLLLRVHEDGSLVWWRSLPGDVPALSSSAAGTVVLILHATTAFSWGGQAEPAGTYLATLEENSTDRWVRPLPAGARDLAVLPAGQVAVIANLPDCGGPEVLRYNLAGSLLWSQRDPELGCDATFTGVGILPQDVVVSGVARAQVSFGTKTLPKGGFLLDWEGK